MVPFPAPLTSERCPLCGTALAPFFQRGPRDPSPGDYQRCPGCTLVVLERAAWPDPAFERRYYRTHENHPDDPGYLRFLERLVQPLRKACPPPARGLDWGCGPHPVLADRLRALGYEMAAWDPVFGPPRPPVGKLDFITCTEVLEHLHQPLAELRAMAAHLQAGGMIAIMTGWVPPAHRFRTWHYRRDPTHVALYGPDSLRWTARHLGWEVTFPGPDVAIFHLPPDRRTTPPEL